MKSNFAKIVLLTIGLISFAVLLWFYFPAQNYLTRITVLGDSTAKLSPDTALITFSVVTQNKQAINAQQENAQKSESVKSAIEKVVANAKAEIKTSDYNLEPEEDYSSSRMPKIIGYEVKNTVTISVNDLSLVGNIIDAATKAGANAVDGISFVIGENSPSQGSSLELATRQAMAKAESIARSLNGKIVRVIETREAGVPNLSDYTTLNMNSNSAMDRMDYKTPIQAGTMDVRSQVILVVDVKIE